MLQMQELLLEGGTAIMVRGLGQKFQESQIHTRLSDCDYCITFPNELSQEYFMEGFCFTAKDYQAVRDADVLEDGVNNLGGGMPYDLSQKSEEWWSEYRSKMQKICAERLFGENPFWKIWGMIFSSVGVMLEYHEAQETTSVGRVLVSTTTMEFNVELTPYNASLPMYRLTYANVLGKRSSTMHFKVYSQPGNEIVKSINIVDHSPDLLRCSSIKL